MGRTGVEGSIQVTTTIFAKLYFFFKNSKFDKLRFSKA